MPGDAVFALMDTHGIPLDVQVGWMRDRGMWFDWGGFVHAALASGNYTPQTVRARLREALCA